MARIKTSWMTGHTLMTAIDVLSKLAGILAIVIGGWWTYSRFVAYREDVANILVTVSADIQGAAGNKTLTFVDVSLKNVGKVPIFAEASLREKRENWLNHGGCELSIIEYDEFPTGGKDPKSLVVDWESSAGKNAYVLEDYDLLAQYKVARNGNYVLNPGIEYHEPLVFLASPGKLYALRARFFSKGDLTSSHIRYVKIPPAAPAVAL
jgi:hypothetical protein